MPTTFHDSYRWPLRWKRRWAKIASQIGAPFIYTQAIASDGTVATVDEITGAQLIIPVLHHEIHEGEAYSASYYNDSIADDADIEIFIITGATKFCHLVFYGACGGNAEVEFFEGTTVNANGAALAEVNRKRGAANPAELQAFSNPTVTGNGTELLTDLLPGGTGGNASGGSGDQRMEFILAQSTNYMLRLTNRSGAAKPASLRIEWYEESDN